MIFCQALDEDLADVMVEDLSSLALPVGWRDYQQEGRAEGETTEVFSFNSAQLKLRDPTATCSPLPL